MYPLVQRVCALSERALPKRGKGPRRARSADGVHPLVARIWEKVSFCPVRARVQRYRLRSFMPSCRSLTGAQPPHAAVRPSRSGIKSLTRSSWRAAPVSRVLRQRSDRRRRQRRSSALRFAVAPFILAAAEATQASSQTPPLALSFMTHPPSVMRLVVCRQIICS